MSILAELRRELADCIELTLTGQNAPGGQIDVGEIFSVDFTVRHTGDDGHPALENVRLALTGTTYAQPIDAAGELEVADRIEAGQTAMVTVRFEALTALRDYIYKNLQAKSMPPFGFVIQVEEQLVQPTEEIASVEVRSTIDLARYLAQVPVSSSPLSFRVQIESPLPPESIGPF